MIGPSAPAPPPAAVLHGAAAADELNASPRLLIDHPIEAFGAIILRHLGGGYTAPLTPKIGEGWVADFRRTFDNAETKPIETLFRADPKLGPKDHFQAVEEGEASWPLFAIWRKSNKWDQHTIGVDKNRVTVAYVWVLPPSANTERNWPLLSVFDNHMRRVLRAIYFCKEDKDLLTAALVRDFALPWQSYTSRQGYEGPGGKTLYPTLAGEFQFDTFWERTADNHGMVYPAFNAAYTTYVLRGRDGSGNLTDTRLIPELASLAYPIPPRRGA